MRSTRALWALRIVRGLAGAYLCAAIVLVGCQRRILFPAPAPRAIATGAGTLVEGRTARGRRVVALWSPVSSARADAPTIAYFHGNAMQLADCAELAPALHSQGWNVFSVEYPGYGPLADDSPSEEALIDVADAAVGLLHTRLGVPVERTVLLGQSIGTGVATALAARGAGSRLVLMSPFLSLPDVAADHIGWLPVRWLIRDRFDSDSLAPSITLPVLILHGTADEIIPFAHGERLSRRFPHATLVRVEGGGHNDLWSTHEPQTLDAMRRFIETTR